MASKKVLLLVLVSLILGSAGILPPAGAASEGQAIYLVQEGFASGTRPDGSVTPSGWDIDTSGGSITGAIEMNDQSASAPVSISRTFLPVKSGDLVAEIAFAFTNVLNTNGAFWELKSGDTPAVYIYASGGALYFSSSSGTHFVGSFMQGPWYIIKIAVNMDTKTVDIYYNGNRSVQNRPLTNNISSIDGISISTGNEAVCTLNTNLCYVYKGYYLNERFAALTTGSSLPSNWTASRGVDIQSMYASHYRDRASIVLNDTSSSSELSASAGFTSDSDKLIWEYTFYMPEKTDGMKAALTNNLGIGLTIVTAGGDLCFVNAAGGNSVILEDYKGNLWYSVRAHMSVSGKKADIYINNKLLLEGAPLVFGTSMPTKVTYSTPVAGTGVMWVDDVLVYPESDLPADYVEPPQIVDTGDVHMGVQTCSLWREGTQGGWDKIAPFPEREPLLGFYDEGNPETADWEIKWLLEHGVSFMSFCWFRSPKQDTPIKDPFHTAHLHEGFLKAKYSDLFKFTIMWENINDVGISGIEDFRDNVLPFWVEYYFKDPRYLVIDDKPVLSIFGYDVLKSQLGNTPVSEFARLVREACIEIGYSGAYILNCTSAVNASSLNEMKNSGFDAVYVYSWGDFSGVKALQQTSLLAQRASNIDVIPTVTVGRDNRAWLRESGQMASPAEFTSSAKWINNEFRQWYVQNRPGSIASKMLLVGNWNEYGEGHYILPSTLGGFEYLDGLRSLFDTSPHTDIVPTAEQKARLNVLYPEGRKLPYVSQYRPMPMPLIDRAKWDFNGSLDGWSGSGSVVSQSNGNLQITGSRGGTTRRIISGNNLGVDISRAKYLKIRLKNGNSGVEGRVYFTTTASTSWNESKRVNFLATPSDSGFTEHIIDMSKNANWMGTLKQIRIDAPSGSSPALVDYICVSEDVFITAGTNILQNGDFESKIPADGADNCAMAVTSSEFVNGFKSLKVESAGASARIWFNAPEVKNNTAFYYSAMAKLPFDEESNNPAALKILLSYNVGGKAKEVEIAASDDLAHDFWRRAKGVFTIEEGEGVSDVKVVLTAAGVQSGERFYIDAVEVRPLEVEAVTLPAPGSVEPEMPERILLTFPEDMPIDPGSLSPENMLINGEPAAAAAAEGSIVTITPDEGTKNGGYGYTVVAKALKTSSGIDIPNIVFTFYLEGERRETSQSFYLDYDGENRREIDAAGFEVTAAAETITAVTSFFNESGLSAISVIALYQGQKLAKVLYETALLEPGRENTVISQITIEESAGESFSAKHLIWDNGANIKPIVFAEE